MNVASRVLTSNIKKVPAPLRQETGTIFEIIQDIIRTNVLTKFHEDYTINVTFRVKNSPPPGGHTDLPSMFPEDGTTNVAYRFDEDRTINLASCVLTWKNAPPNDIIGTNLVNKKNTPPAGGHVFQPTGSIELVQDIIGTNLLTTFHDDWTINVASRVHITKNAPPPGGHVFQPTEIISELVQNIIGTHLLTKVQLRKNVPPSGGHVFQATVTIFEPVQDIAGTNDLTKFHED
ncbi:hypothetical protein DPMN_092013 [Dreissena polymorpha]|uniref:Uncharacterized protein n=1 Tax=Dreissena polymorpha TaxID=45954 RepID=A0A9D4L169_DREPO|nr:hypothetical protein DPMN_092013 [Dreissena polymorpha]